jgi:hypothetical protein
MPSAFYSALWRRIRAPLAAGYCKIKMRMRIALAGLALATLAALHASRAQVRAEAAGAYPGLPSLEADYPLPPLPTQSARNANYTIEARLDPIRHTIEGKLLLEWRNTSDRPLSTFPFHLYWNAFRNNLSTSAREGGSRGVPAASGREDERNYGYTNVRSVRLVGEGGKEADLLPSLRYIQPDDGNVDDRTVMEIEAPSPLAPGATARFAFEWESQIPYGAVGRAGFVHDYNFIVQWFPKIGVFWKGQWNCHQFHATSEFFADYGNYDVRLTLPRGFVLGATGRRLGEPKDNGDGSETFHYLQEDVHDFAWTASRRFMEKKARFDDAGYPPVDIRLLVQPEHEHLATRYLEATKTALRYYGAWSAPYPYPQITVVDPAWNSASGGMEYPTLFTGGARYWAPLALQSPEGVTIHEAGHQFWYGLVGNNEFEEAWLDEGFNSYHDEKAAYFWLGPEGAGRSYFGPREHRGSRSGFPVVAPGLRLGRGQGNLEDLRENGEVDTMARRAWEYRTRASYGLNSYSKPALSLQTLEALLGDPVMTRILRTYARRFRFGHPTSQDFIAVVNEVTGKDYQWFFDQTWYSSDNCDYSISVTNEPARRLEGFRDGKDGVPALSPAESPKPEGKDEAYEPEVVVRRLGGVRMPLDVLVVFADGRTATEQWDGQYRWVRYRYPGPSKVVRAIVDPEGKLAIDVDPSNNAWVEDTGQARRAASKWSARFLFWLQNFLELHSLVG